VQDCEGFSRTCCRSVKVSAGRGAGVSFGEMELGAGL